MRRQLLVCFLCCAAVSLFCQNYCIKNRFSSTPLFTDAQIQKDSNIVFGVAKHWNSVAMDSLRVDIYAPNSAVETLPKRPLIVFAFGGGFIGGNRFDMAYYCKEFAKRGYVCATIDYRLGWGCLDMNAALLCLCNDYIGLYDATYRAMQDFNAALRFLSFKSPQYKIDTNFIFVSGGSAGSITAMNAAFTSQLEIDAKLSWVHKNFGSIDSSGNLYPKNYKIRGVLDICGAVFDTAFLSNNKDISVVSFHDSADCVVPPYKDYIINCTGNCHNLFPMDGSAAIYSKVLKNGGCAELNINPVFGHCQSNQSYIINHSSCFLKRILCNTCNSSRFINESSMASCDALGTGTGVEIQNNKFVIYPQPAQNILNVEMKTEHLPVIISLININGKEVYKHFFNDNIGQIDISSFANGVYYIRIQTNNAINGQKLVINR